MTDKTRKWKDEAADHLRRGKYKKALELFRRVIERDPEDLSCHNNVGYILRKMGKKKEAVQVFVALAGAYADGGFLLKAIATCKVVLEIDPAHDQVQKRLADLYSARTGSGTTHEVKVMAEPEGDVQVGDDAVVPLELSFGEIELPKAEAGAGFEVQRTTDVTDLHEAEPEAEEEEEAPAAVEEYKMPVETGEIEIMPVELEPVSLEEVQAAPEPAAVPQRPLVRNGEPEPAPEPIPEPEPLPVPDPTPAPEPLSTGTDFDIDIAAMELDESPKEERVLPEIPLFSDLGSDAFIEVLEKMKMVRMKPGDWIIREGESGHSMFIIASGAVRVLKMLEGNQALQLAMLGEGAFFGEMSVVRGGPRGASIQAIKPGELFEISRDLLDEIVKNHPPVEKVLKKFTTQRLLRNVMNTSSLFKPFTKEERIHILERFASRNMDRGDVLIDQGELSNGFYIVLRGRMDVLLDMEDGSTSVVGELAEGEVFGEISNLYREPAVATVRAATSGAVLRLPRNDFQALILSHPQILELVSKLGEERKALTANALAKKGILI